MARKPFNGADPAAFDHDADGKPGGSLPNPVRRGYVDIDTGAVLVLTGDEAEALGEALRVATPQDLEIAGRRELIPFIAGRKA